MLPALNLLSLPSQTSFPKCISLCIYPSPPLPLSPTCPYPSTSTEKTEGEDTGFLPSFIVSSVKAVTMSSLQAEVFEALAKDSFPRGRLRAWSNPYLPGFWLRDLSLRTEFSKLWERRKGTADSSCYCRLNCHSLCFPQAFSSLPSCKWFISLKEIKKLNLAGLFRHCISIFLLNKYILFITNEKTQ